MIAKTILCLVMGLMYGIAQAQKSAEVQSALDQRMRLIEDKISSEQIAEGYYIIVGVYSHYKGACTKMKRHSTAWGLRQPFLHTLKTR